MPCSLPPLAQSLSNMERLGHSLGTSSILYSLYWSRQQQIMCQVEVAQALLTTRYSLRTWQCQSASAVDTCRTATYIGHMGHMHLRWAKLHSN